MGSEMCIRDRAKIEHTGPDGGAIETTGVLSHILPVVGEEALTDAALAGNATEEPEED